MDMRNGTRSSSESSVDGGGRRERMEARSEKQEKGRERKRKRRVEREEERARERGNGKGRELGKNGERRSQGNGARVPCEDTSEGFQANQAHAKELLVGSISIRRSRKQKRTSSRLECVGEAANPSWPDGAVVGKRGNLGGSLLTINSFGLPTYFPILNNFLHIFI